MTVVRNRDSVLAVTVESTEGTPVAPAGTGEYVALQEDITMSPNTETLTNNEIKSSLGQSQPIIGRESPTASMSHYLKHSGTEGTASELDQILKAVFGAQEIESTEYDTVSGSSVSVVNVNTGEGATYARGQGLLVKDITNGYSVRNVHSISSDALTLGFNLANAPATGTNLGKAIFYTPEDSGHQSLNLWHYLGNGGALQLLSGARPTGMSWTIEPGSLINANFTFEGLKYFFNPIVIASADRYIDWTDTSGTYAGIITAKTYKDPHELAGAIENAMNDKSTETFTVTYSNTTGKFTIASSTSLTLSLLWNTGTNTANSMGDKIGFSLAANSTGALTYTSATAVSWVSPYTPAYDSSQPLKGYFQEVLIGDATNTSCFNTASVNVQMTLKRTPFDDICAEQGRSNSIISMRSMTVSLKSLLSQYEADKFRKYRTGEATRFCANAGQKDASGNWTPGTVNNLYLPTVVISSFKLTDMDGLVALEMELQTYVDSSGNGEIYFTQL